jgi:cytochrome b561
MNKEQSITLEKHPLFALVRAREAAALIVAHASERLRHKFTRRDLMLKNQSA